MRNRILVMALAAGMSFAAVAENYIVNQAYEIAVDELRLPGNIAGTVSFKDCGSCEQLTVPVTPQTRYVLNDRDVSLAEFIEAVDLIADKRTNIATVIHHLESDTILAVHVVD